MLLKTIHSRTLLKRFEMNFISLSLINVKVTDQCNVIMMKVLCFC